MPRTDLGLMGPNQVGFGLQNHQNQCSIQAGTMIWLNRFQPVDPVEKKSEILTKYSLKNKESSKKNCHTIPSLDKGDMTRTSLGAPNSNLLE